MRTALCFAALSLVCHAASAAPVKLFPEPGYLQVHPVFVDPVHPTWCAVKAPEGQSVLQEWEYLLLNNLTIPPQWFFTSDFWVEPVQARFDWAPGRILDKRVLVDVAEFVAAGDTIVTLRVDTEDVRANTYNVITWESPHLGVVTRTYEMTPEPGGLWLAICGLVVFGHRRFVS